MVETLRVDDLVVAVPGPRRRSVRQWRLTVGVDPDEMVALIADPPVASVFARTIVGLRAPVAGRVQVAGQEVTRDGRPWWRRADGAAAGPAGSGAVRRAPIGNRVNYVPAGGALLPHLTVQENIEYRRLRGRQTVHSLLAERVDRLIQVLELQPAAQLYPHQISPRQRLRTALARAVASAPEALVLHVPADDEIDANAVADLPELIRRCAPPNTAGFAALLCTTDGAGVPPDVTRRQRPEPVGAADPGTTTAAAVRR